MNQSSSILKSYLSAVPWNIDPARNSPLLSCEGINIPTFYISEDSSYTPMHPEDGYLDSCNLLHWGVPGACKVWIFVHRHDTSHLMDAIRDEMAAWCTTGSPLTVVGEACSLPLHHKVWALSTEFLVRHNIRHKAVVQEPGDLVFVGSGVYHQVINCGITLAEAVNVGSVAWNLLGHLFTTCGCQGDGGRSAVQYVAPNEAVIASVKERDIHLIPVHRRPVPLFVYSVQSSALFE